MPNIGQFILHSMANPPLKAGDYTLQGRVDIAGGPVDPYDAHLRVTSPRFTLPPDQMLSTFPPANSEGAYENRLPQIVLKRRTLPWERAAAPGKDNIPWLALVVIAEGEGTLSGEQPIAQCVTPGVTLSGPNDVATSVSLTVNQTVLDKVFPTEGDLPLLCHVREVDIRDTELANGDDDGFLAVVMANRLPQFDRTNNKPVRYLACLINLEGQLDILPKPQPPRFNFLATEVVFDVRQAMSGPPPPDPDRFVMGGATPTFASASPPVQRGVSPTAGKTRAAEWATTSARIENTALTAPPAEAGRLVRDGMLTGFRIDVGLFQFERTYRFPVLAHWSFTVSGTGGFEALMRPGDGTGLDVGLLGTAPRPPKILPGAPPPPPAPRAAPEFTETGHVGLPHLTRRGERVHAWFRGPLATHPTQRDELGDDGTLPFAHASDQLRRVVPDGREDLSLAAAFEIGRLLALSQPSIVRALMAWRAQNFIAERARQVVGLVSQEATKFSDVLKSSAPDLGPLLARHFVLAAADDPTKVLAPSRPLVDPGAPLPFARDGGLEKLLAAGFGFSADAIATEGKTIGIVAALQRAAVPIVQQEQTPLMEGPAVERLRVGLQSEVDRLTAQSIRQRPPTAASRRASSDALDELIARAEAQRGEEP